MPTAAEVAQTILLRGRHSLASVPQLGEEVAQRDQALTGRLVPLSTAEDPFNWDSQVCRSASDLLQTLQWSAGLSGGLGPIPLLKARQDFFESLHTTVFSVSVVVQARRVLAAMTCEEVTLRPDVAIPSDGASLDRFVDTYGDSWVTSVVLGGQMQGIYTLYAQSREQAQEVARAVDVLVSAGTVSLGPSFGHRLKTIANDAKVNVSCRVSVSGLAKPPVITEDNMAEFASSFGTVELDNPVVLSLQSQGYEEVGVLHDVFQPVARNRILLSGQGSEAGLRRQGQKPCLRRQWQRLRELVNQCNWVEGTYNVYGIPQDPSLANNRERLRGPTATRSKRSAPPITPPPPLPCRSLCWKPSRPGVQSCTCRCGMGKPWGAGAVSPSTTRIGKTPCGVGGSWCGWGCAPADGLIKFACATSRSQPARRTSGSARSLAGEVAAIWATWSSEPGWASRGSRACLASPMAGLISWS